MDEPESEPQNSHSERAVYPPPSASFRVTIAGIKKKFPKVKNVSTSTLSDWLESDVMNSDDEETKVTDDEGDRGCRKLVIFDVRPPEEYNVSHLSSAIRLDPDSHDMEYVTHLIQQQIHGDDTTAAAQESTTKPMRNQVTAVMYCSVGYRSSAMADRVQTTLCNHKPNDFDNSLLEVYNLEGSIFKWANEHRPLVDSNDQPSEFVHPYSRLWGLLIDRERWKWSAEGKT